jgi:hypothetical protein
MELPLDLIQEMAFCFAFSIGNPLSPFNHMLGDASMIKMFLSLDDDKVNGLLEGAAKPRIKKVNTSKRESNISQCFIFRLLRVVAAISVNL